MLNKYQQDIITYKEATTQTCKHMGTLKYFLPSFLIQEDFYFIFNFWKEASHRQTLPWFVIKGLNISQYTQKAVPETWTCLSTNNNIEIHKVIPHYLPSCKCII